MGCFRAIANQVVITIELLINSISHNTEKQQSQNQASPTTQKAIAPIACSIDKNKPNRTAKIQTTQKLEQSDRTFMKCVVGLTPYLVYRVFILKLKLIKEKLKQQLESLFTSETKTSEIKFKEIRQARRKNNYFYHGIEFTSRSGLTRRGDELISLKPGTKVKILTDFHSSSLSDDNRRIMVYVRPTDIKTKEKYLVPLDNLIQITTNSDSYIKAVLPQIKTLVAALGLTREDYLQHIQQAYSVKSTRQLWSTEIFEVVVHFQNLLESSFNNWLELKLC
jgi:hypothetical protein